MSRPCLYRSSDERGSCRSLWPTHGRTHVDPKDYEDRLFLVDHGGILLSVRSEVPRVPDALWSHSHATFRVACTHIPLAIFSVGYYYYWNMSPKSSSGHEYILVAIDYFTKWLEVASYARLKVAEVAKFIRSHIIFWYGVPHELISDRGVHFRGEVDTLVQEYGIQHHRSSVYRPQTNGVVKAANKNIKQILWEMIETSRDWSEKLPFAL